MPPQNKPDPNDPVPIKKLHIQARLHNKTPGGREAAAIEAYEEITAASNWDQRRFITEAAIALKMHWNEGWRPPEQSLEITAEILQAVRAMSRTAQMLSELDLTSLRSQAGWNDNVWQQGTHALDDVNENAADLLGTSKKWIDPDDD